MIKKQKHLREMAFIFSITSSFLFLFPRPAYAVFGVGDVGVVEAPVTDALLSESIAELGQLISLEFMQGTDIASTLTNIINILETANEALAVAQDVKQGYETLSSYSLEDIQKDALAGLNQALPQLGQAMQEIETLRNRGAMIGGYENNWGSRGNRLKNNLSKHLRGLARLELRGGIYPSLLSNVGVRGPEKVTETDQLVAFYHAKRGNFERRAQRAAAQAYVTAKVDALVQQAESGDQLDLQISATTAQAMVGAEGHLEELVAAKRQEIADGVKRQLQREKVDEANRKALAKEAGSMMKIGVIK